jgi:UMF1 family MFS transporter
VLGGSQALSRSLYSQLIPRAREAEYFAFYEISERGTSWLGTLTFALTYELSGSYRVAIVVLVVFFVAGGLLLRRVRVGEAIDAVGNPRPAVL